jgi:hypothetical protein
LVFPVILLWRAEYGDTDRGSRVSKDVVFNKIFNAPDASNLRVSQNGMLLGFVQGETTQRHLKFHRKSLAFPKMRG